MPQKLKRFLLRYDPPGIGLEVQDGDTAEIVHKDLPLASKMQCFEDLFREVDRIIEEDDLLTVKRHRGALLQLLSRLYGVDVPSGDQENANPKSDENSASLEEGATVVLVGLRGELVAHNGELGVLTKCRHEKQKYEVTLTSGPDTNSVVKIKAVEHLIPTLPKGMCLAVGMPVVIRGLRNHTELNGCLGRVVECHEESHRYEVRARDSGQLFRVKQENVVPIDSASLPPAGVHHKENHEPNTMVAAHRKDAGGQGSMEPLGPVGSDHESYPGPGEEEIIDAGAQVMLTGLKTAMAYNGQGAEVLSVDRARGRYEIKLSDGSVKTIRSENVRLVARPSKSGAGRRKDAGKADKGK